LPLPADDHVAHMCMSLIHLPSTHLSGPNTGSDNQPWSGYIDVADPNVALRYVASNFTVPTLRCPSRPASTAYATTACRPTMNDLADFGSIKFTDTVVTSIRSS
jgi:hypothetical protein